MSLIKDWGISGSKITGETTTDQYFEVSTMVAMAHFAKRYGFHLEQDKEMICVTFVTPRYDKDRNETYNIPHCSCLSFYEVQKDYEEELEYTLEYLIEYQSSLFDIEPIISDLEEVDSLMRSTRF